MHFEPPNTSQSAPGRRTDLFDELLRGTQSPKPTQKNSSTMSTSQNVEVKLEFDDATIDMEAAIAYLARFRYHVEYPNQLVVGL
jgi:hypothetical protein